MIEPKQKKDRVENLHYKVVLSEEDLFTLSQSKLEPNAQLVVQKILQTAIETKRITLKPFKESVLGEK